jgi:transposase
MVRERGYPGSAIQVQRYVRTVRPAARAEAYLRLDTLPGEQAQVDWGNFGQLRVGSTTRLLSCFALVLSWSRGGYARFALDQTLESFLRGHVEAFTALDGVPRTLLYDNLKSSNGSAITSASTHGCSSSRATITSPVPVKTRRSKA